MNLKYIWELGSLILTTLGAIHLYYTFFSDKFSSKKEDVINEMESSHPKITRETTMWKAWIGFNASHSSGAMFIGIMNIYLIHNFFSILKDDIFFLTFNIITISFYLWLAKKYWFKIPFYGILISLICFLTVLILTR